jgi:hypothetical protein
MDKSESRIQAIKESNESYQARLDWAEVTGGEVTPLPVFYRNKETGAEYSHITGGIGWPEAEKPGYGIIVAVEKSDEPNPSFYVLDETEAEHPSQLLEECGAMRERWGFLNHSEVLRVFHGDGSRFDTFTGEYNARLVRKYGEGYGQLIIVPPSGFGEASFFEQAIRQVQSLLRPEQKRLYIGKCEKIRSAIQNLESGNFGKAASDSPPIVALSCVINAMITLKPWTWNGGAFNLPDF